MLLGAQPQAGSAAASEFALASMGMKPEDFAKYLDEPFGSTPARPEPVLVARKRPLPDIGVSGMEKPLGSSKAAKKSARRLRAASKQPAVQLEDCNAPEEPVLMAVEPSVPGQAVLEPSVPVSAVVELPLPSPAPPLSGDLSPQIVSPVAISGVVSVAQPSGEEPALTVAQNSRHRGRRFRFLPLDYSKLNITNLDSDKVTVLVRPSDKTCDLGKLHQGRLFKELSQVGVPDLIRDIRGGGIAVDLPKNADPGPFIKITKLLGVPVKVSLPAGQICRPGIIHGLHPEVEEQEFLEDASSDSPIIGFTRLARPGQSSWVAKLLFQGTLTPKTVRYAGRSYRVSEYRPKPRQCGKCLAFDHGKDNCRRELRCPDCGGPHSLPCTAGELACVNCGGAHSATHSECPARDFHVKVAQVRAATNLSAQAAKAAVHRAARTYAAVAANPPVRSPRPEASRNTIFVNTPTSSERATSFVADVVAAVLAAAKEDNYGGLLPLLERILTEFTGTAVPDGALKGLIGAKTQRLRDQN